MLSAESTHTPGLEEAPLPRRTRTPKTVSVWFVFAICAPIFSATLIAARWMLLGGLGSVLGIVADVAFALVLATIVASTRRPFLWALVVDLVLSLVFVAAGAYLVVLQPASSRGPDAARRTAWRRRRQHRRASRSATPSLLRGHPDPRGAALALLRAHRATDSQGASRRPCGVARAPRRSGRCQRVGGRGRRGRQHRGCQALRARRLDVWIRFRRPRRRHALGGRRRARRRDRERPASLRDGGGYGRRRSDSRPDGPGGGRRAHRHRHHQDSRRAGARRRKGHERDRHPVGGAADV